MTIEMLKSKISDILKNMSNINEDGGIEIYTDYRDRKLSVNFLKEIFENKNPREAFNDKLCDWAMDYAIEYGEDELKEEICKKLSKDEKEFFEDNFNEIWDFVRENTYFYYEENDFNEEVNVNIMVDCGNGNYDYTRDNVLNWDGRYSNGELEKESSILWLAKTQGKATLLRNACKKAYKNDGNYTDKDKFIESCIQEFENLPSHMGTLTFLVKMPLFQLFDLIELQNSEYDENAKYDPRLNKSKSYILLGKETECGLYDPWNGSGSVLEIELNKDVKLPVKFVEICVDGCKMRGYDVDEVYGLIDSCWKKSVKEIKKVA